MLGFKEHTQLEALSMQQRMKAKINFKKNKAKIMLGRKKAAKKLASPEKLKARAIKQARSLLLKKMLKTRSKDDLSFAGKQAIEKKLAKKTAAIKKIAKKLVPQVKAADRAKKNMAKKGMK
jgi:adenylate kinase